MSCYIKDLREENRLLREAFDKFSSRFYCMGGPLNDNVLQFDTAQQVYLARFQDEMKQTLGEVPRA